MDPVPLGTFLLFFFLFNDILTFFDFDTLVNSLS